MVRAVVIGAGLRGDTYASYIHPSYKVVGVVDPDEYKRNRLGNTHGIAAQYRFGAFEELISSDLSFDSLIVTSPDTEHFEPARFAIENSYNLLLEKPMATTLEQNKILAELAEKSNAVLQVCHVLRYTDFFATLEERIRSGLIGDVVNISMRENVAYYHYAHSFVRGNWHNKKQSSPMILAKCCHDLDIMQWIANSKPRLISSFGGQNHFPKTDEFPNRCTDGCEFQDTCLYYAPHMYMDIIPLLHVQKRVGSLAEKLIIRSVLRNPGLKRIRPFSIVNDYYGWPIPTVAANPSLEAKRKALEENDYGRCVFRMDDHDVVDHQVVSVQFDNGITGSLIMQGFSPQEGRSIRVDGTRGSLIGEFSLVRHRLIHQDTLSQEERIILDMKAAQGHGGGDTATIKAFIDAVEEKNGKSTTGITESLISHIMAFAADKARIEKRVVEYEELQ